MQNKSIREFIVTLLTDIEKDESYVQLVLKNELDTLESKDKAFANEVIYGTIKYQLKLDYIINQFSKTPVRKMKPFIRNLMRMSVYQLFYLDKVPHSAVINEAVKIIHKRKMSNLSGFVNGVLRNIARNEEGITYPDPKKETIKYLSVMYSIPEWIVGKWLNTYGMEQTEAILGALNERAQVSIRYNPLKGSKESFLEALKEDGIALLEDGMLDESYYVHVPNGIHKSKAFQEGRFTVQDESAMLVGRVLNPSEGDRVLDMCSAPGGKTTHIAELMNNKGEVIGADVHEHKINIITKHAQRMGASCITATLQDGTIFRKEWENSFDKVLLDVPCSGLGIIKRKPDIRYRKTAEDLKSISALQQQLLENAIKYLKVGGTLVYSTCTLTQEENEDRVKEAVEKYGLELSPIESYLPDCLKSYVKDNAYIQILPFVKGTDGFFIARFEKKR